MLALKANQPTAHDAVETFFAEAVREDWHNVTHAHLVTDDAGHGRLETRRYWTTTDVDLIAYLNYLNPDGDTWPDLRCVGMVVRKRTTVGSASRETRYYLSSLDGEISAFAAAVRSHWSIENTQHWALDMAFREDESRVRIDHAAENLAILRRIALNLVRLDRGRTGSVHTKRLKAGRDHAYLLHLLSLSPQI